MNRPKLFWLATFACIAALVVAPPVFAADIDLRPGDKIVILGGTFVEREGQQGIVESHILAAHAGLKLSVRNLGWSGDTVWAESRGIFDAPAVGYQRMLELVKELSPTVILLCYGQNESFAGEAGLEAFKQQYRKLHADLAPTGARFAVVTPHLVEVHPKFLPKPKADALNQNIRLYSKAIVKLAQELDVGSFDMTLIGTLPTTNGLQLSVAGYQGAARALVGALGKSIPANLRTQLPELQKLVVEKNELFFHRWRPQNITYLTGFRKHEQGNNAKEIMEFEPLVTAVESKIHEWLAAAK